MEAINKYEVDNHWPKNFFGRNYKMCNARDCRAHNVFDIKSIMHYGPLLEGTNITVIKAKQLCNGKPCTFGQRKRLSLIDIKDIISLYGCGKTRFHLTFELLWFQLIMFILSDSL